MILRPMIPADVPQVVELDGGISLRPWTAAMFLEELHLPSLCSVLAQGAVVAGFSVARLQLDEWHLLTIGVAPAFRRQGLGQRLMQQLMHHAIQTQSRSVMLEVRVSNHSAREFYATLGFDLLYVRKNYYNDSNASEDALVLDWRTGTEQSPGTGPDRGS